MSNSKFEVGSLWMDTRGGCVKILANDSPDPQNPVVGMNMQSYMIYRYNENGCGDWNLKSKWREPINASFYIAEDDQPEFQPENVDRLLATILDIKFLLYPIYRSLSYRLSIINIKLRGIIDYKSLKSSYVFNISSTIS